MIQARTLISTFKSFLASNKLVVGAALFYIVAAMLDGGATQLITVTTKLAHEANPWVRDPNTHAFLWKVGLIHTLYWFILGGVGASWLLKKFTKSDLIAAAPFFIMGFDHWRAGWHNMRFLLKPLFWILQ